MPEQSWAKHAADVLRRNGIRMFATVPDYIVGYVLDELWADPECRVVTTTREEEAVGLLSGAWLAGQRGALLMQNSGRVIRLDGDGSLLMNLGSLCTIAAEAPRNYVLMVWDNEVHQTTGGQATATASKANLVGIARGAGIEKGLEVRTQVELERAVDRILKEDGPFIVVVKVEKGPTSAPFDQDLIGQASRFRRALATV